MRLHIPVDTRSPLPVISVQLVNCLIKHMRHTLIILGLSLFLLVIGCHWIVSFNSRGKTFDNIAAIPHNQVGLLLATSPFTAEGVRNLYYENRIKATVQLYKHKRIDQIIVSGGDYSNQGGYNELISIRDSLKNYGIPDSVILLDYEGTRTLNSIRKAKDFYRLDSLTLISQEYHNERAIYLAERYGIKAIAYNAETPDRLGKRIRNEGREYLARVKMFIDLLQMFIWQDEGGAFIRLEK